MTKKTPLQIAQPVLLPHVLLTYVEQVWSFSEISSTLSSYMCVCFHLEFYFLTCNFVHVWKLERDAGRYIDCRERLNFCPLGACALAGTGLPIDSFMTASALGFTEPMRNSFRPRFCVGRCYMPILTQPFICHGLENLCVYDSKRFGLTGKQYNASEEESRSNGACQRKIRYLVTVLTLCKGLPLAYNRDFQEDKEPMFDSNKTIMGMIHVSAEFAQNVTFNKERIKKSLPVGHLDATTLADYLVKKGMPFRSSHDIVGKLVGVCVSRGCQLQNLSLEEMKKLSPILKEMFLDFWALKIQSTSSVPMDRLVLTV